LHKYIATHTVQVGMYMYILTSQSIRKRATRPKFNYTASKLPLNENGRRK